MEDYPGPRLDQDYHDMVGRKRFHQDTAVTKAEEEARMRRIERSGDAQRKEMSTILNKDSMKQLKVRKLIPGTPFRRLILLLNVCRVLLFKHRHYLNWLLADTINKRISLVA